MAGAVADPEEVGGCVVVAGVWGSGTGESGRKGCFAVARREICFAAENWRWKVDGWGHGVLWVFEGAGKRFFII